MRAIAIKEPFATQIADGKKKTENRSRRIALGPLLVLSGGQALCLVDVVRVTERPFTFVDDVPDFGFAWHLANPRRVEPFPARTFGWIVHVPDEIVRVVGR